MGWIFTTNARLNIGILSLGLDFYEASNENSCVICNSLNGFEINTCLDWTNRQGKKIGKIGTGSEVKTAGPVSFERGKVRLEL